ncbi:hypothetical protein N7G274_001199 [Stereocaulon virgatum]|uniref:Uncharacterized protein n=1 Tax=Stereocaulon virgatum TaxID=373712 RepID=A0ABR4AN65_9LECA
MDAGDIIIPLSRRNTISMYGDILMTLNLSKHKSRVPSCINESYQHIIKSSFNWVSLIRNLIIPTTRHHTKEISTHIIQHRQIPSRPFAPYQYLTFARKPQSAKPS